MRARATSPESGQPTSHDALTALVRLLAREAARECMDGAATPPEQREQAQLDQPDNPNS